MTFRELHLLSEEDFLPAMEGEVSSFLKECVQAEDMKSFDGTRLRCYRAVPEQARAAVVLVHGFCEFFGKYHEMAWYLYRCGYAVFFPEQRGHGYSEGKLSEPDIVHIDSFDTYVKDLECFLQQIVKREAAGLELMLFAHSMGGAVAALYLEQGGAYFRRAVFSSPMLKLTGRQFSSFEIAVIACYASLTGRDKKPAPGEKRFDETMRFESSSALSRARYEYLFRQRLNDAHYRTWCASLGWGVAGVRAMRRIMRDADRIRTPLLILKAGRDTVVDTGSFAPFAKAVPGARIRHFEDAKHEIFNAGDAVRREFYEVLLSYFAGDGEPA